MSVINTNITSQIAQKNLTSSKSSLTTAMERLSSGMRINSAKDDAAGQAIANRMTAQVKGMAQAQRNANDGISLVQTAEGSLNQINDNLQRVRELAVQAANDTNSEADRASIATEIQARVAEIDRVAQSTNFNGKALLNADDNAIAIQVGSNTEAEDTITINLNSATAEGLEIDAYMAEDFAIADIGAAQDIIDAVDAALKHVDTARSGLGSLQNRFESAIANLQTNETNLASARSRIEDADYAVEVSNMTRAQILQQAGTSVLSQANQVPQGVLKLLG